MWGEVHAIPRQGSLQSLLDVFESTKDLVYTMERAALFKKKNYGELMSEVFITNVSNHKRIRGHLRQIIFKAIVKQAHSNC